MPNNQPFLWKLCKKCNNLKIASIKNFTRDKGKKYNVSQMCKICAAEKSKAYRKEHPDKVKASREKHYSKEENRIKKRIQDRNYYKENKEMINKKGREYYKRNSEQLKNYQKIYKQNNHDKVSNWRHIRRINKRVQGRGVSAEQIQEMYDFFNHTCAYSGEPFNNLIQSERLSDDHIIPLSNEGLHEPWNIVPMKYGYNSSKGSKDMITWYKQQEFFNIDRLMKIYEWQEYAYEKWGQK